jgi:hypothetical protein
MAKNKLNEHNPLLAWKPSVSQMTSLSKWANVVLIASITDTYLLIYRMGRTRKTHWINKLHALIA